MKKLLLCFSLIALTSTINAQWTSQATGFSAASRGLTEIKIVDANTVWGIAYDGSGLGLDIQEFTVTTNGGDSWNPGTIDVGNTTLQITNISPVSGTTAWVGAFDSTNGLGGVFKTSNGGSTWEQQNSSAYTTPGVSWFNVVHFFNANVGLTMGDPIGSGLGEFEIYKTIDGGDNWTAISATALPNPLSGEYGYNGGYVAAGGSFWFTTNKGRVYRTTDQGLTWTVSQAPITDFGGEAQNGRIYFSDANNGYLQKNVVAGAVTTRTYATTTNGGATWSTPVPFTGTRFILNYIPGTTTMVATSQAAPVGTSISTNNGATWTDLEPAGTEQRGASAFLNSTTGWCAGFSTDPLTDGVFKLTGTLGTQNFENATKFKVYPNPASSIVTISAANVDSYKLSVTDITGKVVMTKSLNGIENTLDISSLSTGAYFFELSTDNIKDVVKILKN
jgi:photosystem II stability/assembly factor-like uncharacterized protein